MEKGIWGNPGFIFEESSKTPIGVNLGWYGCAEHESGSPLSSFGIVKVPSINSELPWDCYIGKQRLSVAHADLTLHYFILDQNFTQYDIDLSSIPNIKERAPNSNDIKNYLLGKIYSQMEMGNSPDSKVPIFYSAWDSSSFALITTEYKDFFPKLETALLENRVELDYQLGLQFKILS